MPEPDDGIRVLTQSTRRWEHSKIRWAYVIERPGWWPHVSAYRYGSEATARAAGERDAAELRAFLAEQESEQ